MKNSQLLRKGLAVLLSSAFVLTSIPGTALVAKAEELPTPKYQFDFEGDLQDNTKAVTAIAKTLHLEGDFGEDVAYDTGFDGTGQSLKFDNRYGVNMNLPEEFKQNAA